MAWTPSQQQLPTITCAIPTGGSGSPIPLPRAHDVITCPIPTLSLTAQLGNPQEP